MKKAIGLLEFSSIAKGIVGTDAMVKTANVELLQGTSVCPGKFIAMVAGDISSVKSAVEAGIVAAKDGIIDRFVLANVDDALFPALIGAVDITDDELEALGVIETFSVASAIVAADAVAKAAVVRLLEVRVARGMGGKALVFFTGDVGAVQAALEVGISSAKEEGSLADSAFIPSPYKELWKEIL